MKITRGSLLPQVTAVVCTAFLIPGAPLAYGQNAEPQQSGRPAQDALLSPEALDSMVAPIALYPDDLMAQVLAAATYPLEIVDANRWLKSNSSLKGDALVQAAAKQNWEPCIQALVIFPAALNQLDANLQWTTALGNAFLAQQEDVILAVQRLRQRAQASGALTSNAQQKVDVQQVEGTKVVVIQPANPEVIYVPAYNPVAVFERRLDTIPIPRWSIQRIRPARSLRPSHLPPALRLERFSAAGTEADGVGACRGDLAHRYTSTIRSSIATDSAVRHMQDTAARGRGYIIPPIEAPYLTRTRQSPTVMVLHGQWRRRMEERPVFGLPQSRRAP